MRYSEAVLSAPPGAATFQPADVARLSPASLRLLLAPGRSAPPLDDVAAGLAGSAASLRAIAETLPPARGERLMRLAQRPVTAEAAHEAGRRLVRGLFWPLVYELAPERWDALAAAERVHPDLLAALPVDGARVLDVAAGTGRLTEPIARRAAFTAAAEPSGALRARLRARLGGGASVVAALSQALPFADRAFDVALCCAGLAPDPPLGGPAAVAELERVAAVVALVGPDEPRWFEARGYARRDFPAAPSDHFPELEAFFGPLDPPRVLLVRGA